MMKILSPQLRGEKYFGITRDPRDSDPRKTTLARASSIYKRLTRPLVRDDARQKKTVTGKE
jgi:hypothetical protein